MPSPTQRAFASLSLLLAAFTVPACGSESATEAPPAPAGTNPGGGDAPKAAPLTGTPDASELTSQFGIFVAPNGQAANDGAPERPLNTIQAGINLAKQAGKRVYVCAGTFREAITIADSIAIIGGLDCSSPTNWKLVDGRTIIESPTSPAMRAKGVVSVTRLEGLDVASPDATEPSASSIGLFADHSAGIVLVRSTITAHNGANGTAGADAIQLVQTGAIDGGATIPSAVCGIRCQALGPGGVGNVVVTPGGGAGGTSVCTGAPGHDGVSGGAGGTGGVFTAVNSVWHYYNDSNSFAPAYGQDRDRKAAVDGTPGASAAVVGTLTVEGYVAAAGVAGTDGAPGNGGFGGRGSQPVEAASFPVGVLVAGVSGPGGGAGGCPGLAGMPGTGGGASIAVALVESPMVMEKVRLVTSKGGTGGLGSFGSDPTAGGSAGANVAQDPILAARWGGTGGSAGISTNGSNGPSLGVLHLGPPPIVTGASVVPGPASDAIPARSHIDGFGKTRTVPATPSGVVKDILAL